MHKQYKYLPSLLLLIVISTLFSAQIKAHSVQVGYCTNCNGDLRIWVEHWHSTENPSTTTMTLQLDVNGTTTTTTSSPGTSIQNTAAGALPGCFTPITIFGSCPGDANTYLDWVAYDFPAMPVGVPITVTILSGNTVFTQDACGMYPASTGIIVIPPPPGINNVVSCGGSGNPIGPIVLGAGATWTNDNPAIGLPAAGAGDITFTPTNSPNVQVANVTITNGCGTSTFTITINPSPAVDFSSPGVGVGGLICPGQPIAFTDLSTPNPGDPIVGWNWDFGDGTPQSNLPNPTHNYPLNPTTFNVTFTVTSASGCSTDTTFAVNFGGPTANFTAPSVCEGSPTVFTDVSTPIGTMTNWAWDFDNDGIVDDNSQNPNFTFSGVGTNMVELFVTAAGGCVDSVLLPVVVNPIPIANFTGTSECLGFVTTFNDLSGIATGNIIGWSWDFGDAMGTSILQSPTYTYTNSGVYNVILTITSDSGCTHDTTIVIDVYDNPVADFTSGVACAGFTTNFLDATILGSSPISNWNWDFDADAVIDDINQNPNYIFPGGSGAYNVNLNVVDNNGCVDDTTITINVSPQPTATFTFTNECSGTATSFTDLSSPNGGAIANWDWDFDNDGVVDDITQNPANMFATANAFTVELLVTDALGCVDSTTMTVIVNPNPDVSFTGTDECLTYLTTFTNNTTIASGTSTWAWDFGDALGTSTNQNPTYTYLNSGIYNVTLTATSDSGCTDADNINIEVFDNPIASFIPDSLCLNLAASFNDLSNGNGGTINQWDWDFGNTNTSNQQNITELYAAEGVYNTELIVTTTDGCSDTINEVVAIYPMPAADFNFTDECFGTAIPFTDVSTVSNLITSNTVTQWDWDFQNDGIIDNTNQNPSEMYLADGQYTVQLTVTTDNNCSNSIEQTINVWPLPVVDFTPTDVCLDVATDFMDLSTVTLGTNVGWQWDFADGIGSSNVQNPVYTYLTQGPYQGQLIVTTNYGCVDSLTKTIDVHPVPVINFGGDTLAGCATHVVNFGDSTMLNAPGIMTDWLWDFGNGQTSTLQNPTGIAFPNPSNSTVATFDVSLMVTTDKGCVRKDSIMAMVSSYPMPIASFSYSPQDADIYDREIIFEDNSIIASNWLWDLGDGTTTTVSNPIHEYPDSGTYLVTLYMENVYGCKDTTDNLVRIRPAFAIWIPNAFTPTADGINDGFLATGFGIKELHTLVYDRWGMLMYEGHQLDSYWNGGFKGKLAVTDVYVYKIRAKDVFNEWHEFIGKVTLLK
jgi:gliding motility-associated-like protein